MSDLRDEIVDASRARTEFLKWKLIGASALGTVGLGFTEHAGTVGGYLVLTLIPPVCFYVDLLCRHISLRILVIGRFLRMTNTGEHAAYEQFAEASRHMQPRPAPGGAVASLKRRMHLHGEVSAFAFEDAALIWSTLVLSLLVVLLGVAGPVPGLPFAPEVARPAGFVAAPDPAMLLVLGLPVRIAALVRAAFIGSGLLCAALTIDNHWSYRRRIRMLDNLASDPAQIAEVERLCRTAAPGMAPAAS